MNWIMGYPIPCIFIGANAYQYNDEYSDLYDRLLSIILNTWGLIKVHKCKTTRKYTVAVYSWSIANNFVIDVYCRCLENLCQIA